MKEVGIEIGTIDGGHYLAVMRDDSTVIIYKGGRFADRGNWDRGSQMLLDCVGDLGSKVYRAAEQAIERALRENNPFGDE